MVKRPLHLKKLLCGSKPPLLLRIWTLPLLSGMASASSAVSPLLGICWAALALLPNLHLVAILITENGDAHVN
jgi:hypothetical protein